MDSFVMLTSNEWIASYRNQQCVLINTYTKEEYASHIIPRSHPIVKEYRKRQVLLLPHTPKIVLLDCDAKLYKGQLLLLIQNGQYQLSKLVDDYIDNSKNLLDVIYNIIKIAHLLHRKYGCFLFTKNMIKVSKGPQILLWIHQNYYMNVPQFPLLNNNVKHMVLSLMDILGERMPMVRLIKQLRNGEKEFQDFDCVMKYVLNQQVRRRKLSLTPSKIIPPSMQNSRMTVRNPTPSKYLQTKNTTTNLPRKHRESYDSYSTKSDNESQFLQIQSKKLVEILDQSFESMVQGILKSQIMPDLFYYFWSDDLADQFGKLLND